MKSAVFMVAALAVTGIPHATAQSWPAKPIRMVVPFPAGGTSDILARMIGPKITEAWGQQVIVDNRPGANANIGAELVARSAPDGYTLILMDLGSLTISPTLYPKLGYDFARDLTAVGMVSYSPHLIAAHPSVPVRNLKELIALAKANPGKLNYPTGLGGSPHLAGMMLAQRTGINWVYVPTKGGTQSIMAVATGEGDALFMGMLQMMPHVKAGRLKILAISSEKRDPALPSVPTVSETAGLEGFVTGSWQGVLAPAKTPAEIVNRLNAEVARIVNLPDLKEKLAAQGTTPLTMSPADMGKFLLAERDRWALVIRKASFKLE